MIPLDLKIDKEFQDLIPPLSKEEYEQLEKNIVADGCRDSLVVWNETIVDGHNRYEICNKYDIPFKVKHKEFESREQAKEWIIINQFGRRNLNPMQRSELALHLKPIIQEQAKEKQNMTHLIGKGIQKKSMVLQNSVEPLNTQKDIAKIAGVSHDSIWKTEKILKKGTQEQIDRARLGGKGNSLNAICEEIRREEQPKKVCKTCGKELPITDFYAGKGDCKTCYNQIYSKAKDMKGNTYKIAKELIGIKEADIIGDLYNEDREVEYTIEDVAEDFTVNFETYFDSLKGIFEDNKELIKENKEKMEQVLLKAVDSIMQLKGEYLL